MVVLVNNYSASASEIVAACLQDYGRAVIVGERTWGKGTVQNILEVEGGRSAIKLTTATYWRPSGQNIHRHKDAGEEEAWGVQPDKGFVITMTEKQLEKVFQRRRARDRYQNPESEEADPSAIDEEDDQEAEANDSQTDESATSEPTEDGAETAEPSGANDEEAEEEVSDDDPQLRAAIEYLKKQLREKGSKAQAA